MQETQVQSLCWEDPLEEGMATYSSILAWEIPWTEEPGGLQSMGSQRVRHNDSDLARRQANKGVTEEEMIAGHHLLNGHEFEQTLGDSERQRSLACCSPWGYKESDTT